MNKFISRLFLVGAYLGVGAFFHAWRLSPTFDPHNLWSWGWLAAWPVGLAILMVKWLALGVAWFLGATLIAWIVLVITKAVLEAAFKARLRRDIAALQDAIEKGS